MAVTDYECVRKSSATVCIADTLCRLRQLARLRMYGSGCNMSQITLQAIQDTKVDMQVWLGAYIGDNSTVNEQQKQCRQAFAPDRTSSKPFSFLQGHLTRFRLTEQTGSKVLLSATRCV